MTFYHYPCRNAAAQTVVLSAGLGGHAQFWNVQIDALTQYFHVLTYDQEGVAPDSAPLPNDYQMQDMAQQLIDILQQQKLQQCHFIGHALGAFIGMEVAKKQPELLDKLIFINAWDNLDPHTDKCFQARIALLQYAGVETYVRAQALFLYPPAWISEHIDLLQQQENKMIQHFAPVENVFARLNALRRYSASQTARAFSHHSLVIVNQDDFLVPWQRGVALFQALNNAELCLLPQGAHASTVTQTAQVNQHILQFLLAA